MRTKSQKGLRRFQLKVLGYGNSYYIERIAELEAVLAKEPHRLQIDMIGEGEIPADMALLIRSILTQRTPNTRIITNARSSLQGGSVLVWLSGDSRVIREDARVFFRRIEESDDDDADKDEARKETELKYSDSYSETDPEDADYAEMLKAIDEFLPVKELAGRPIKVSMLRQFGLVENEKLDRFLAAAFGKPQEPAQGSASEAKEQRIRATGKPAQMNK
jgi:hypothetical protein